MARLKGLELDMLNDRGQCSEKPRINSDWYSSQQTDMFGLRSKFGFHFRNEDRAMHFVN